MSLFAAGRANGMTGNQLQQQCVEEAKPQGQDRDWFFDGICEGFIIGVVEVQYVADVNSPTLSFCLPPDEVTNRQLIKIVEKYLDNHPELLHKNAALLVMQAIHDAFPCRVEQPRSSK